MGGVYAWFALALPRCLCTSSYSISNCVSSTHTSPTNTSIHISSFLHLHRYYFVHCRGAVPTPASTSYTDLLHRYALSLNAIVGSSFVACALSFTDRPQNGMCQWGRGIGSRCARDTRTITTHPPTTKTTTVHRANYTKKYTRLPVVAVSRFIQMHVT